jgi:broad specificity phosphatase PhoE
VSTRLFLVRHAESEWNAQRRWQGHGDVPLSEQGRAEAALAAEALRHFDLRGPIVASPLMRALETAEIIASVLARGDVETDDDFKEIDVGDWTGKTIEEVEELWGAELAAWRAGELEAPPGGESRDALVRRVLRAIERVAGAHPGESLLVVTHGGVIGRLERHLGVHPGRGSSNLEGRWFVFDGELAVDGERVLLAPADHGPAPEAR